VRASIASIVRVEQLPFGRPQGVDAAAMLCRRNGFEAVDVFIEAVRHALEVQLLLQRRSRQCSMQRSACNVHIAPAQAVRTIATPIRPASAALGF
jgi:hypothetical protein